MSDTPNITGAPNAPLFDREDGDAKQIGHVKDWHYNEDGSVGADVVITDSAAMASILRSMSQFRSIRVASSEATTEDGRHIFVQPTSNDQAKRKD